MHKDIRFKLEQIVGKICEIDVKIRAANALHLSLFLLTPTSQEVIKRFDLQCDQVD
jgi:hypothetical protein